jgi:hypothetical protein
VESQQVASNQTSDQLHHLMQDKFEKMESNIATLTELILQQNRNSEMPSTSGTQSIRGRGRPLERGRMRSRGSRSQRANSDRGSQRTARGTRSVSASRRTRSFAPSRAGGRSQFSSISRAAQERMNDFINQAAGSAAQSDFFTDDRSSLPTQDVYKTIYIKKIDCQINSTSIDQVDDKSDVDQTMQQYFRMSYFTGQLNSLFSNGISYEDFRNGYFFAVYDFSTSGHSGSSFLIPSIRVGHTRLL